MAPHSSDTSYTSVLPTGSELQSDCRPHRLPNGPEAYWAPPSALKEYQERRPGLGSLLLGIGEPSQPPLASQSRGCGSTGLMTFNQLPLPLYQQALASPYSSGNQETPYFERSPSAASSSLGAPVVTQARYLVPEALSHSAYATCFQQQQPDTGKGHTAWGHMPVPGHPLGPEATLSSQVNPAVPAEGLPAGQGNIRYSPRPAQEHPPPTLTSCANSPYEPPVETPASRGAKMSTPAPAQAVCQASGAFCPEPPKSSGSSKKGSQPYAKLIERALLSAPNHRMQLQEIYAWFVRNTDKAMSDGRGWQNSIRHNLSMNAAFTKTQEEMRPDGSGKDSKRSTEWMLQSWAVKDGVQSTTRYRKPNSSRKTSGAKSQGQPYRLDARHTTSDRVLESQGKAWQDPRHRLRRRPYHNGDARLSSFANSHTLAVQPAPPYRATAPCYYPSNYALSSQVAMHDMVPAGADQSGTQLHYGLVGPPPVGFVMPNVSSTGHGPHPLPSMRAQEVSGPFSPSLYYKLSQGIYPYNISNVHVSYGGRELGTARGSPMAPRFNPQRQGTCRLEDGEI